MNTSKYLRLVRIYFIYFLVTLVSSQLIAQEPISKEDYESAISFLGHNITNKKLFNAFVEPQWFKDSTGLWYVHYSPENKTYKKLLFEEMDINDLFDHSKVALAIQKATGDTVNTNQLPIRSLEILEQDHITFSYKNEDFIINIEDYSIERKEGKESYNSSEAISPDAKWIAYAENYNLFIKDTDSGTVKQLTHDGEKGYEYATWYGWGDIIEGENGDRPERFNANWSEDNQWIHANLVDFRTAEKMYLLDWSIDSLYKPKLLSYYRGSPGDTGMVYVSPVFINIKSGRMVRPDLPRVTHINQINIRPSAIDHSKVYLVYNQRGYQHLEMYSFNLETEELDLIYEEDSKTNIDNFTFELVEEKGLMLLLSEKSGWRQLYRLDLNTKEVSTITNGEYFIDQIEKVDQENERIYFSASGKELGRNPYFTHLYRIDFDGNELKLLTPENLHHRVDIGAKYFVDNYSTVNIPTKTALRSLEDGTILKQISGATVHDLDGWEAPEVFSTTARDGITTIYGAIWKPTNFDPQKKYPLIEMSYTGPHTQVFPRDFSRSLYLQNMCELGFIVMVVDGLGSSGRSKAFHDYSYKNLGGNLADHVLAIRYLGETFSWIDTNRVGIFGHSAGGYDAAHALLAYPNTYHVGVASSADHDHRMEKAWWPEMYMGWPIDSAYHQQSNVTMAGNLEGKLLITHGGIDENVNPSASFKLAEALIKADKPFDMLILPSQRHGYQGVHSKYFTKLRWNYFVEHLRGVEPIWDISWD